MARPTDTLTNETPLAATSGAANPFAEQAEGTMDDGNLHFFVR